MSIVSIWRDNLEKKVMKKETKTEAPTKKTRAKRKPATEGGA